MEDKVFLSKKDPWISAMIGIAIIMNLGASVFVMMYESPYNWLIVIPLFIIGAALPLWIVGSTKYVFSGRELRISSGPLRMKIKVSDIQSVTPTSSILSSPALSLDRLLIKYKSYKQKSVMVSPLDKDGFIKEIERRKSLN